MFYYKVLNQTACKIYKILFLSAFILFQFALKSEVFGQTTPTALPIYGGRIGVIKSVSIHTDTSRLFITTESANSLFYSNIVHSGVATSFGPFNIVTDFYSDDGFGESIKQITADSASQYVFVQAMSDLYSCSIDSGSRQKIVNGGVFDVTSYNGNLFYLKESPCSWF